MSENPFGGAGGFDMNALLEQAQQMQAQLAGAQDRLAHERVEGTAGGTVTVTLSGVGDLVGVQIKEGSFDGSSAEDLEDLGDLIVAAFSDAKGKAEQLASQALGPMSGGFPGLG